MIKITKLESEASYDEVIHKGDGKKPFTPLLSVVHRSMLGRRESKAARAFRTVRQAFSR